MIRQRERRQNMKASHTLQVILPFSFWVDSKMPPARLPGWWHWRPSLFNYITNCRRRLGVERQNGIMSGLDREETEWKQRTEREENLSVTGGREMSAGERTWNARKGWEKERKALWTLRHLYVYKQRLRWKWSIRRQLQWIVWWYMSSSSSLGSRGKGWVSWST